MSIRGRERDESTSLNSNVARLVKLIGEMGPDISQIAERLGQFKESVRYRYKEKLLAKGFAVQVMVDHEKLGLKRVVMLADFAAHYQQYAQSILWAMSELCYVVSFERVLPEGTYVVHASVPREHLQSHKGFMEALVQMGIFVSLEYHSFDWFRNLPMKAELYDFDAGVWDFDWGKDAKPNPEVAAYRPAEREEFDPVDLLILKELQIDANKTFSEMAQKLKINYKTLTWHFRKHVKGRLLKGYTVNWMGTRFEYKLDRAMHRKHTYLYAVVLFGHLHPSKRMEVMARFNSLPFIWCEAAGTDYLAELAFPVDSITEALQYISGVMAGLKDSARYFIVDQSASLSFSIAPQLYDSARGQWQFDEKDILARFQSLVLKIREGSGE